jgi:ribonuclease D
MVVQKTKLDIKPQLPAPIFIDSDDKLKAMVDDLLMEAIIGVDTEANSMYSYETQVCLVQISSRQQDYIVDPFRIKDMQGLGDLLCAPQVEKIFHAAEYDLICLKRQYGFDLVNLFDTMLAARVLGAQLVGLGDLLGQYFEVPVDKSHQQDDWSERPLPSDRLLYAQMDTHYLPALYDLQKSELLARGSLDEAKEVFHDVLLVEVKAQEFDPESFWRLARPEQLTKRQLAILRELFLLREDIARNENLPPFKVMENRRLVELASNAPNHQRELYDLRFMQARLLRTYGDDIMSALQRGKQAPPPVPRPPEHVDPIVSDRYIALHNWRKETAQKRGVESNVIVSKHTLRDIARLYPQSLDELGTVRGMGEWRLSQYGQSILDLVKTLK